MNQSRNKTASGLSRRAFIRGTTTAIAGFSIIPRHVLGGAGFVPPSEKVNIAIADPIESQNLDAFYYKGAAGRLPVKAEIENHFSAKTPNYKVAAYEDFRVLLEKEKLVDAILCATPNHLHAYVSVSAMRLKKHVYCEKPLTHNVWEARQ